HPPSSPLLPYTTLFRSLVPEGIEGQVPYKGAVSAVLHQLAGGLRASMGYTGSHNLKDFRDNSVFVKISGAALNESHVHNVTITRDRKSTRLNSSHVKIS